MQANNTGVVVNEACQEILEFVNEGMRDVEDNQLLEFDAVFDELERRYAMND